MTTRTNTFALPLLAETGVAQNLSVFGIAIAAGTFLELVDDQDERLAAGAEVSRIPLLWRSLAETVGLTVDNEGRIVDGPRGLEPAELACQCLATAAQ